MYINLITIDLCPGQSGGGVTPSGTLNISENGEYNVKEILSPTLHEATLVLIEFKKNLKTLLY